MITREIENQAVQHEGAVPENWEFIGAKENIKNILRYYMDPQGKYHCSCTQKRNWYDPVKYEVKERDGMTFARRVYPQKRTGRRKAI